ncbi:hypothetical protein Tco_0390959 [Tanacetum coccineum]
MLAPKCSTYNGRPTFANPRYLKKAQSDKPCLYEIPYDTSDPANRFAPDREGTMTLDNESRSKLNKDYVKPYDYTNQNSLYEIFKGPSLEYLYQLERTKEVRKTMWRKPDYFRVPTAHDMELLIKTLLMPLSIKSQNDSFRFEHELKTEMHEDFEYVKSLENEVDELESEKADFSNMYDLLIEECVSKDVTCSYLHSLSDLNAYAELQYVYLHKVKECESHLIVSAYSTPVPLRIVYSRQSGAKGGKAKKSVSHNPLKNFVVVVLVVFFGKDFSLLSVIAFKVAPTPKLRKQLHQEKNGNVDRLGITENVLPISRCFDHCCFHQQDRVLDVLSTKQRNEREILTLVCDESVFSCVRNFSLSWGHGHAVATASAQNDNGSLEAESIVRAASTSVRFRLSKRVPVQVFEEWKSDVQCLLLLK